METEEMRAFARRLWDGQRSPDEKFAALVDTHISTIPLESTAMKHCPICEGVACGVCGRCHEDSVEFVAFTSTHCPAAVPNNETQECLAWSYAYRFLDRARRDGSLKGEKSR